MSELEFGILGPVRAEWAGSPVRLTRPRERALLAALLVSHGQVVSVDRLAQALWGAQAPETGRRQVAICVSRLRQAFTEAGGPASAIATSSPGYVIAGGQLDALRFEELTTQARAARSSGRVTEASELFRTALGLWRGPALEGVDRPFGVIEAARLEEWRTAAAMELIDCELDLGRHAEVTGELLALVTDHPLRERLRGQLMLALYRSGRGAEAQDAYRDGRQLLVTSLGVEPGPELQQLYQGILRGDAALLWTPPARARAAPAPPGAGLAPAQLPPDVMAFTGRTVELDELTGLAAGPAGDDDGALPIAVISGVAGTGKTGLAVHWGHQAAGRFPDGQLFADLRGYDEHEEPLPAAAVLDQFLRGLGVPAPQVPAEVAGRTALLRTLLNRRRVLIVLDNARTVGQVRPLLPGSGTCFVLVTSRSRLDDLVALHGARVISLGPLTPLEAADLVTRAASPAGARALPGEGQVSRPLAERIASLCDRLPLAIRIAAARIIAHPESRHVPDAAARAVADRLADEHRRLSELSIGGTAVRASFALGYRELPGQAAGLLRRLGLLDVRDFAGWIPAALLEVDLRAATELLDQLISAGLVEPAGADRAGQPRYRLHDLVRLFARELTRSAESETTRQGALARVFGAALHLTSAADDALGNPFIVPFYGQSPRYVPAGFVADADPLTWLQAERAVLTSMVAQAARVGLAGYAWELTVALSQFLATRRYLDDWEECATRSVAAARADGDERGEAAALLQLADRYGDAGRFRDAARLLVRAIRLLRRDGDARALAIGLSTRALVLLERNGPACAQRDAEQALALLGPAGVSSGPAAEPARTRALTALGLGYLEQGRHADATVCFDQVLSGQRTIRGQVEARYRLATAQLLQGDYREAADGFADAMRTATQAGDVMTAMMAQVRLGQAYVHLGALDQAEPLLEEAARCLSDADSPKLRALTRQGLARIQQLRAQRRGEGNS